MGWQATSYGGARHERTERPPPSAGPAGGALPEMLDDPGALFDAELERALSDLTR